MSTVILQMSDTQEYTSTSDLLAEGIVSPVKYCLKIPFLVRKRNNKQGQKNFAPDPEQLKQFISSQSNIVKFFSESRKSEYNHVFLTVNVRLILEAEFQLFTK